MRKIILIIDNSYAFLDEITLALSKEDFTVLNTLDGMKGLKIAFAEKPSLILVSELTNSLTGYSVIEELKKSDWGKNIPVILLASNTVERKMINNLNGDYEYIVKSKVPISDIVNKVKLKLSV